MVWAERVGRFAELCAALARANDLSGFSSSSGNVALSATVAARSSFLTSRAAVVDGSPLLAILPDRRKARFAGRRFLQEVFCYCTGRLPKTITNAVCVVLKQMCFIESINTGRPVE